MTCYFRHQNDLFEEAGITVTKENRKAIDRAVHEVVGVKYKDCPSAWREVEKRIADKAARAAFVQDLKKTLETQNLIDT